MAPIKRKLDYTVHDRSGLRLRADATNKDINQAELETAVQTEVKYLSKWPSRRSADFSDRWMLRLHREMFGKVWVWGGKIRRSDKNIGIPWLHVANSLYMLSENLKCWDGDPVEDAALLHFETVRIHPFEDGNGRWARLLTNIWLAQKRRPVVEWPSAAIRDCASPLRGEYIEAIREADQGRLGHLVELHKRYLASD
jgi:fido (protein-threonine AMPylation protein)